MNGIYEGSACGLMTRVLSNRVVLTVTVPILFFTLGAPERHV